MNARPAPKSNEIYNDIYGLVCLVFQVTHLVPY